MIDQKKILYVVNDIDFFISHRLPIAQQMITLGFDVYLTGNINKLKSYNDLDKINIIDLKLNRSSFNPFINLRTLYQLKKIIKSISPNILHLITLKPIIFGLLLTRYLKIDKIVCSITGLGNIYSYERNLLKSIKSTLINFLLFFVIKPSKSSFIVQNSRDYNYIKKFIKDDFRLNLIKGSGVNLKLFNTHVNRSEKIKILMACRIIKEKGIIEYLHAANLIQSKLHNTEFVLCGKIDSENPSHYDKDTINDLCIKNSVKYVGYINKMEEYLNHTDVSVLPSYYGEGIPKFLIESLAAGKPIITTNLPGCRDVIFKNINGILIEPKNHKSLYKALYKLINDKKLRLKMGLHSREFAIKYFDIEDVIKMHIKIYHLSY